jgi:hypothetical protein
MKPRNPHTDWCARDQRCNLREHRGEPIVVDIPGLARGVLTRVRAATGEEHAEIRIRLALHPAEPVARRQLRTLLAGLRDVLGRAAVTLPTDRKAA